MILYIIGTPIGNLADISQRTLDVLNSVDAVACEDTRVTGSLLAKFHISKPLLMAHQHAGVGKMNAVLDLLGQGKDVALVTDAGTPTISDPGGLLVQEAVRRFGSELKVIPIPGPSALIAALSISGFPADSFLFLGFPPHKKGRQSFFDRVKDVEETVVFYESTHRILKTLAELQKRIEKRPIVVCRELTKLHETTYRGTVQEVTQMLENDTIKGEFVIVLAPNGWKR